MSAVSTLAPAGAGRIDVRPRFRIVSWNPRATAASPAAALMVPVPPMKSTLRFVTFIQSPLVAPASSPGVRMRRAGIRA